MKVYLSGGMKDGWQDLFIGRHPEVTFLDPRSHGLKLAKDYVKRDMEMIDESDFVFGYLPLGEPIGIGLSAEFGYAKAKGKPIYLAIERNERSYDFIKTLANKWVGASEEYTLYGNASNLFDSLVSRVLVWFSCGAASAVAAKLAVEKYGNRVEILYCDTLTFEHTDNIRFLVDVERWIGKKIKILKSKEYSDIYDVFDKTGWLVGPGGARCTVELKKAVRHEYEQAGDIQVFGFTSDEQNRIDKFDKNNPEITADHILMENSVSKAECYSRLKEAGIELPMMYRLGYRNNNCIGCVKGGAGYWNKIRVDFPEAFDRMAKQERKMDVAINKRYEDGKRIRVFLDELPPNTGRYEVEPDIECGVLCLR